MGIIEKRRQLIVDEMEAGRGGECIFPHPVSLEPPYRPYLDRQLGSLRDPFFKRLFGEKQEDPPATRDCSGGDLRFILVKPSRDDENSLAAAEQFILSLPGSCPASFEIVGNGERISFQLAVIESAALAAISQLRSHFPGAECTPGRDLIKAVLSPHPLARAYRLRQSHFFPLGLAVESRHYHLKSLYGAFSHLKTSEAGVLQILFIPAAQDWPGNIRRASRSSHDPALSPFVDLPALPKIADKKLAKPLYSVSLRVLASSEAALKSLERFFNQLDNQENGVVPLAGDYPVESILKRDTHVYGSLLNLAELSYFVHLPAPDLILSTPAIEEAEKTLAVPEEYALDGPVLGMNSHRGTDRPVRHSRKLPNRHVYSCGKSGYGKSNLILSAVIQRIEQGDGLGVVDPHGSLVKDGILPRIPRERIGDVIYFNAGDFSFPMALNPMAHSGSKMEKEHIRVDLLDFFEGLFDAALGVNVQHALNFFIITLLQFGDSTLLDLERLLIDKVWRVRVLESLRDERVRIFWKEEYPQLEKRGIITAIANKLSPLVLPDSTVAPMLTSRENKIDFLDIMNKKKIFLANLSHGDIGKRNSQLLGKLLVSKLQIAAMMRKGSFPDWFLYIDEFQHMVTPSMADILSGARKYGLHLWLANQMMGDVPDAVLRHVFNAATMIFFATDSPSDQMTMEKTLSKRFKAEDIGRLKKGEAFVKMANSVFNMTTARVPDVNTKGYADEIIAASRAQYSAVSDEKRDNRNQKPLSRPRSSSFSTDPMAKVITLADEERTFLEHACRNPGLSVTRIYKAAGLSAYMGDKLKTVLKDNGLVKEVTTHLGQGSRVAKFLFLTLAGFSALQADFGQGKGGTLHRYWQSVIRVNAERSGYAVNVEEQILGGKEAADLGLWKDGNKTAVEISVTTTIEHELDNAGKCLKAGYGRVIILFLDELKLKAFETLIKEKLTEEERLRVKTGLAYDFGRFF